MNLIDDKAVNPEAKSTPEGFAREGPFPDLPSSPDTASNLVRMPVDARGLALAILATVAVIFALQWAQNFFVPLLLGIIIAYTINPPVCWMEQIKVPRAVGASIVMVAVIAVGAFIVMSLGSQVQTILEQLPEAASKLSSTIVNKKLGQPNTMQKVQAAAQEIEKATNQAADVPATPRQPATRIVIETPPFKLGDFVRAHSMEVFGFISQTAMVLILIFFLLLAGDTFKRKLVRLAGPLSSKKITVKILDDINLSIQNYMFTLLVANVVLAISTWLVFRWIGLENAGAWAVAAGVLHVVPYFGPALIAVATGLVAFLQFDSLWMAVVVSGSTMVIAIFVGMFLMTWMTGRMAKMNASAVFISLLFWTWLWGVAGLLLAIPIIGIIKVVSHYVEELQPLAELLGDEDVLPPTSEPESLRG